MPATARALDQYRELDLAARVASASPQQLVAMLFDGLRAALRVAERAVEQRQAGPRIRAVTRALAILDGLESSLDFAAGGPVARTLAVLYGELRALVVAGNAEARPELLGAAAARVATLGAAWSAISRPAGG